MTEDVTYQIVSNVLSIVICALIVYKYLQYKKRLTVLEGLENLKNANELTIQDKEYITQNEKEYSQKALEAEANMKILYPALILVAGIILAFTSMSEAMIYLNVVVVAFLYFQLDKNHKKTTYSLLHELNKEI